LELVERVAQRPQVDSTLLPLLWQATVITLFSALLHLQLVERVTVNQRVAKLVAWEIQAAQVVGQHEAHQILLELPIKVSAAEKLLIQMETLAVVVAERVKLAWMLVLILQEKVEMGFLL
jgi:hypothetical protein